MVRTFLVAGIAALTFGSPAHADWYQASSKHFVVYSDDAADRVNSFTEQLERFDKAMRVWHVAREDNRGPSARVTVFVLSNVGEIERLSGSQGVAGFYIPRAGGSVAFVPRSGDGDLSARAVLFHEYAHHWMLSNWTDAALPPWFVEGFAELHATAAFTNNMVIFGGVPTYRRYTVGQTNLLPMDRLLQFNPGNLSPYERDALYSRGWALTHYLTFDEERRKLLAGYIGALNSGKAPDPKMLVASGGNLDLKIDNWVRRRRLPSAAFSYDQLPIDKITVRKLSPGEAAIMPAYISSHRGVDAKRAPVIAGTIRRIAVSYPNDANVQNELAEAEYDVCETSKDAPASCYAATEAAAGRAIAADPKSIHAQVYMGMAKVAELKADKITDATKWNGARQYFLTANRLDTETPTPLIAFYDSFAAAGQAPSKNAQSALLYAYALAPYDPSLRLKAAQVYLHQDKVDDARVAITPIAYNIEAPSRAAYARAILDAMNSGGAKAALAELNKKSDPGDETDESKKKKKGSD